MDRICPEWSSRTRAFTLIELLAVIAIMVLLISIMLPSMSKVREQGKRTVCRANLHSIGQALYLYAHDNKARLIPGDYRVPWDVWALAKSTPGNFLKYKQVNLGHLLTPYILPIPNDDDHVFFCPSSRGPDGARPSKAFIEGWGSREQEASITYMFNNALGGFETCIQDGSHPVLSHKYKVNFLLGDGSVQVFDIKPLLFDQDHEPELLQEVCARYGVCFPTIMLHRWFEKGQVDLAEAAQYLADPTGWYEKNATGSPPGEPVLMATVGKTSLVSDVVGVWPELPNGGETPAPPPG
jgi:prepilin-type N-terminal cleavage/methylation domain-containing protein